MMVADALQSWDVFRIQNARKERSSRWLSHFFQAMFFKGENVYIAQCYTPMMYYAACSFLQKMREYICSYDIVKKLLRLDSIAVAVVVFFVLFLQGKNGKRKKYEES